ncbi:hypothetical protein [Actinoplanes sp. NPDC049681]
MDSRLSGGSTTGRSSRASPARRRLALESMECQC